jgi:hypothetical protein
MMWLGVLLVVVIALMVVVFIGMAASGGTDPAHQTQAAIELHRIGRQLDMAQLKMEQRRDSSRLRQEIGAALEARREP